MGVVCRRSISADTGPRGGFLNSDKQQRVRHLSPNCQGSERTEAMAKRKARKAGRSARPARKATPARASAKRPTARKASGKRGPRRRRPQLAPRVQVKAHGGARHRATRFGAQTRLGPGFGRQGRQDGSPPDTSGGPPGSSERRHEGPTARSRPADARRIGPEPPSSLDMDRRGSAARTGRAEFAEKLQEHHGMTPTSPAATSTSTSRTRTSPARKRPAATIRRPTRTSSTTSARRLAWNTRTTRS